MGMDVNEAIKLHRAGRFADASAIYRAILAATPDHVDAAHLLGLVALQEGRLSEADVLTEKAVRLRPDNVTILANRGEILRRLGRFGEARAMLERAIGLDVRNISVCTNLALVCENVADYTAAQKYITQALEIDPTFKAALDRYLVLCRYVNCYETAVVAFHTALDLVPGDWGLRESYAQLLYESGDADDAEAAIRDLLERQPNHAARRFQLGELEFRRGDVAAAVASLRSAIVLDPNLSFHGDGRIIAARIASLRASAERMGGDIVVTIAAHTIDLPSPAVLPRSEGRHWERRVPDHIPDVFVTMVRGAEVFAPEFVVLSDCGELFLDGLVTSPAFFSRKKGIVVYSANDGRVLLNLPSSSRVYDQECALIGRSQNHFHFVLETLPRLWSLRKANLSHLPVVVPEALYDTQIEMLARFGYDRSRLIMLPENSSAKFNKLHIPTQLSFGYALISTGLSFLRELLVQLPRRSDLPARIYVSRNRFGRRRIANEEQLLPLLEANGFVTIYPEALSFTEQAQYFHGASVIFSLEGSAMANLVFAEVGTHVGLANPDGIYVPHYYFISGQLGHRLTYLQAQPVPSSHASVAHQDLCLKPEVLANWLATISDSRT